MREIDQKKEIEYRTMSKRLQSKNASMEVTVTYVTEAGNPRQALEQAFLRLHANKLELRQIRLEQSGGQLLDLQVVKVVEVSWHSARFDEHTNRYVANGTIRLRTVSDEAMEHRHLYGFPSSLPRELPVWSIPTTSGAALVRVAGLGIIWDVPSVPLPVLV